METGYKKMALAFESLICFILLFMPLVVSQITSIYTVETPSNIWYKYTSFDFSAFAVVVIVLAAFKMRKSKSVHFLSIIGLLFFINFFSPYEDNVFATGRFEMFLIMLQAAALNYIVFSFDDINQSSKTERAIVFIKVYFILCFFSTLLRLFLGMSTDGRFGAMGLSVGGTGFFSAIMILYLIYCEKYSFFNLFIIFSAVISLVLSGQRTCIFIFLALSIPYFFNIFLSSSNSNTDDNGNKKMQFLFIAMMCVLVLFILILLLLISVDVQLPGLSFVERVFDTVSDFFNGNLSNDGSVEGRWDSIEAGLAVWAENPLGIPNDFYSLQGRMIEFNYPTFPHCTALDLILLWTVPIAAFVFGYCIRLWLILAKNHDGFQWVVLFIIIMSVIWGSPFLAIAQLFIELFFITLSSINVKTKYSKAHFVLTFRKKEI